MPIKLPGYMAPSRFVWIDELPLTPNGKLDRRRLVATLANERPASGQVAPARGLEDDVARLMADVLRIPSVGARDNFFECGGQSPRKRAAEAIPIVWR